MIGGKVEVEAEVEVDAEVEVEAETRVRMQAATSGEIGLLRSPPSVKDTDSDTINR